ncbi:MAG: hypothetical protein A4E50_01558 [Methanosaeta sp. PtaB.Bin087]|nr:MAG: hypothetical protein A4E50_01558 [Methanosaeta sp. PtaB.Bin087]
MLIPGCRIDPGEPAHGAINNHLESRRQEEYEAGEAAFQDRIPVDTAVAVIVRGEGLIADFGDVSRKAVKGLSDLRGEEYLHLDKLIFGD